MELDFETHRRVLSKADYYKYTFGSVIFFTIFYGAMYLKPGWLLYPIAAVGAVVSFFLPLFLFSHSLRRGIVGSSIAAIAIILCSFSIGHLKKKQVEKELIGLWQSDNSGGLTVRVRIEPTVIFLSQSPTFEEIEYSYQIEYDRVQLYQQGELQFGWELIKVEEDEMHISIDDDVLIMYRQKE